MFLNEQLRFVAIKSRYERGKTAGWENKLPLASPAIMAFARKLYVPYYECMLVKENI